jgi:5-methylcytosine-specific restriction protein B
LLVDEINRGNLPRIFGELLYLLEYRDEHVALTYSAERDRFALPSNLWLIGTMNTADRSIGLIDAALRRRFHFRGLFPGRPPVEGLLRRWLDAKAPTMTWVADLVDRLNDRLRDRFGEQFQVGHSYFMQPGLDDEALERTWDVDIMPLLEDQLYGQEAELARFTIEELRDRTVGGDTETTPEPTLEEAAEVADRSP